MAEHDFPAPETEPASAEATNAAPATEVRREEVPFTPAVRAYLERGKPTFASILVSCLITILGSWVPVAVIALVVALTGHRVDSWGCLVAWVIFTLFGLIILMLLVRQALLTGKDLASGSMVRVSGEFEVQPFISRGGRGYALTLGGERVALAPASGELTEFKGEGEAEYLRYSRTLIRFSGPGGAGWVNPGFAERSAPA